MATFAPAAISTGGRNVASGGLVDPWRGGQPGLRTEYVRAGVQCADVRYRWKHEPVPNAQRRVALMQG
jgi:hypothetical protein